MKLPKSFKELGGYLLGYPSDLSKFSAVEQFASKGVIGESSTDIDSTNYKGGHMMPSDDFWLFSSLTGVPDYHFNYSGHASAISAVNKCAPLSAIINKKVQAFVNGKRWIMSNSKEKESQNEVATKVRKLFNKPNPIQSEKQFFAQAYSYVQIFEYNVVLFIKPFGFKDNLDAYQMWNIPPSMIDFEETNALFKQTSIGGMISKVVIRFKGQRIEVSIDDILIIKGLNTSCKSLLFPDSRIKAHQDPINNIISAYEARRVLMKRRGALGILSNDSEGPMGPMPLMKDEKEALQREFQTNYGIMPDQFQIIITAASLKWQAMGYPTKELMLFEEVEDNIMRLCDGWNFPYRLLANQRTNALGGTDVQAFQSILYQDAIIPEAEAFYEQWSNFFRLEDYRLRIDSDFSHIAILQEDKVKAAEAEKTKTETLQMQFQMNLVTINEMLIALDRDPLGAEGDVRISDMKNSSVPLAVSFGLTGVQGLVSVITAQGMSDTARQAMLEIVFGLNPADAARMAVSNSNTSNNQNNNDASGAAA
jgi:hypothetical protein